MSEMPRELVLASTSPRRRDLLMEACYAFSVIPPEVPEIELPGESPEQHVLRLALEKGRAVAARLERRACVLAADTLVVLGPQLLGKPRDAREAQTMLLQLAGRTHRVLTGFALLTVGGPDAPRVEQGLEESLVTMRSVTSEEARAYAATGEPLDKAGGYAVQGAGGDFVERIEGSRSNVIGLPLEAIQPRLERLGVRRTCAS